MSWWEHYGDVCWVTVNDRCRGGNIMGDVCWVTVNDRCRGGNIMGDG